MAILQRVAKVVRDADEMADHDDQAVARAAIATMFNWLGEPSDRALDAAILQTRHDVETCRRIWSAMLGELRHEAGF